MPPRKQKWNAILDANPVAENVHPAICAGLVPLRGAGSAMIFALCRLAVGLKVPLIWGEATQGSASFYEAILGRKLTDHFFFRPRHLRRGAADFDRLLISD